MAAEYQVVDIWVGLFPSETAFDEYFSEDYEKEDDDAPISQFGLIWVPASTITISLNPPTTRNHQKIWKHC